MPHLMRWLGSECVFSCLSAQRRLCLVVSNGVWITRRCFHDFCLLQPSFYRLLLLPAALFRGHHSWSPASSTVTPAISMSFFTTSMNLLTRASTDPVLQLCLWSASLFWHKFYAGCPSWRNPHYLSRLGTDIRRKQKVSLQWLFLLPHVSFFPLLFLVPSWESECKAESLLLEEVGVVDRSEEMQGLWSRRS